MSTAYATMTRSAVPKLFWARPKTEFGEHLATQASNNVRKNDCCMDAVGQKATKFVCNFSNLLLSTYATNRQRQAMVTLKIYNPDLDRLGATHFSTLRRCCFGFALYFGNHRLGSTNQPSLCLATVTSIS